MPSITEAKITGLKPFTTYSFSVCSINSIGETCTENNFNGTTSEDGVLYFFPLRLRLNSIEKIPNFHFLLDKTVFQNIIGIEADC
jgi:hypothetical protein